MLNSLNLVIVFEILVLNVSPNIKMSKRIQPHVIIHMGHDSLRALTLLRTPLQILGVEVASWHRNSSMNLCEVCNELDGEHTM